MIRWYIFMEAERQAPAPSFRLRSTLGHPVGLDDYRQTTNLVLLFASSLDSPAFLEALSGFQARRLAYLAEATAVLAILPGTEAELQPLASQLGGQIPLLADREGKVRAIYASLVGELRADDDDLLFVLDRYGAPVVALATGEAGDPEIHKEILDWLTYSEIKCPE